MPTIQTEAFGRLDRLSFVSRRAVAAGLGGEHRSRLRAPSSDFVDHRPYGPGDDFRRVDWNVYGRLGALQVKVTEGRERLELVVALDCSASMSFGAPDKLAFACHLAAALTYVGLARSDTVRLVPLGRPEAGGLGPLHGRGRMAEVVRWLSGLQPAGPLDLAASLAACVPKGAGRGLVVIVSDLLAADGLDAALDHLALIERIDTVVLHVLSPQELEPDLLGELELIDAETGERLELGSSLQVLAHYRDRLAAWCDGQADACANRGVRYARLRTDRPLPMVMLDDLRSAGVLR